MCVVLLEGGWFLGSWCGSVGLLVAEFDRRGERIDVLK